MGIIAGKPALTTPPLLIHEADYLDDIGWVHASHGAGAVGVVDYLSVRAEKEFAGLEDAAAVFPSGTKLVRLSARYTMGHGE